MRDEHVYNLVFQYVVLQNLYKSLLYDHKGIRYSLLKLRRVYPIMLEEVIEHVRLSLHDTRQKLRRNGCRVLIEKPDGKEHYYVMYRHKSVTQECQFESRVLLTCCEDKMRELYRNQAQRQPYKL